MVWETLGIVALVLFGILSVYLVQTLSQLKRTLHEAEQTLALVRREAPSLIEDVRRTVRDVQTLAQQANDGTKRVRVFTDALGDIGWQLNHLQSAVTGRGQLWYQNGASLIAGLKAVASNVGRKFGAHSNGGQVNGQ